jgi:hypothetical protein
MKTKGVMSKTRSELLFEQFCNDNSIRFSRVDAEGVKKTPDYDVFLHGTRVVAEVKELTQNDADTAAFKEAFAHGATAAFSDPSNRIRRNIGDAAVQLKSRTEGTLPAIVILYNNGAFGGIDSTDIKNAMYGHETVRFTQHPDGSTYSDPRLGGGRKCTATDNCSLSGVALLWLEVGEPRLSLFHNVFSKCPLPYEAFRLDACSQFSIDLTIVGRLPEWFTV